ncbi:MAG: hypothetical protein Q7K03_10630 [Dehalococcoidia bacterium]|nr:hypothetical protein [Dehalococcoidia bacterium]
MSDDSNMTRNDFIELLRRERMSSSTQDEEKWRTVRQNMTGAVCPVCQMWVWDNQPHACGGPPERTWDTARADMVTEIDRLKADYAILIESLSVANDAIRGLADMPKAGKTENEQLGKQLADGVEENKRLRQNEARLEETVKMATEAVQSLKRADSERTTLETKLTDAEARLAEAQKMIDLHRGALHLSHGEIDRLRALNVETQGKAERAIVEAVILQEEENE